MANTMTRVMALDMAIASMDNAEAKEVLTKIKASIEKKSGTPRKPTERQKENAYFTDIIFNFLSTQAEAMQVSEIIKAVPELDGLNTQRVTPMVSKDNRFVKISDGKKSMYTVEKSTAKVEA